MSHFSLFVKSLSRLFIQNKIDKEYLDELLANKKLNEEEYNHIISHIGNTEN